MASTLSKEELYQAKELCVEMGECTATYFMVMLIQEVEQQRNILINRDHPLIQQLEKDVTSLRSALHEARDFIASVECEEGLTWQTLVEKIDAALRPGGVKPLEG